MDTGERGMSRFQPTYDELEQMAREQLRLTWSIDSAIVCEHAIHLIKKVRDLEAENADLRRELKALMERH